MAKYISALVISFFIYAFSGWIWESFICPIATGRKLKNSGFLNGPIVPIYGVGAIVVVLLFSPKETHLSIFIEGAFVACVIEYFTSWIMEKMYHQRWWDYSEKAFNVNGRVCLEGFFAFGIFSVIAVKYIQPLLMEKMMLHSEVLLLIVATALTTGLLIDLIYTVVTLTHLAQRVDDFVKGLEEYASQMLDEFEISKKSLSDVLETMKKKDLSSYQILFKQRKFAEKRILKAFPHLMNKKKNK